MQLSEQISRWIEYDGFAILSGIHPNEIEAILERYESFGFSNESVETEKNWGAVVLRRAPA